MSVLGLCPGKKIRSQKSTLIVKTFHTVPVKKYFKKWAKIFSDLSTAPILSNQSQLFEEV